MSRYKIHLDRPKLTQEEINQQMDFDKFMKGLPANISEPFYKLKIFKWSVISGISVFIVVGGFLIYRMNTSFINPILTKENSEHPFSPLDNRPVNKKESLLSSPNQIVKNEIENADSPICSLFAEDSVFWIEKENRVQIKLNKADVSTQLVLSTGKIIAKENNRYVIGFDKPGSTVVSVYEISNAKRKLIHSSTFKIKEPDLYFCGVKVSSISHSFKMHDDHLRAYSTPFDTILNVIGFDMVYNDGARTSTFHSDNNMLSAEMRNILFEDSRETAKKRKSKNIFFDNILARMPNGSKKSLSPFMVSVVQDSTRIDEIIFNFEVKKMKIK